MNRFMMFWCTIFMWYGAYVATQGLLNGYRFAWGHVLCALLQACYFTYFCYQCSSIPGRPINTIEVQTPEVIQ